VGAAHHRIAAPLLLDSLESVLGEAWTPELEQAWRLAYHLMAEAMLAAYQVEG
jgi:hemoglobin-like flavoprotein